jgi:hypothetical protein
MKRRDWVETDGTVSEVYVDGGGRDRSVSVVFTYMVDGHYYSGTYSPFADFPTKGETIPVRYDPDDPNKNDLVARSLRNHWIVGIAVALFFIVLIVARIM